MNKHAITALLAVPLIAGLIVLIVAFSTGEFAKIIPPHSSQFGTAIMPTLGAADSFSVLAQTAITNVPNSVISGDVGMNNFSSNITGLTSAEVAGTIYATDAIPVPPGEAVLDPDVQADAAAEFNTGIPGQASTGTIGPALDGLSLTTGVYDIGAGRLNGGVLTLNGPGVYIFRASSDFVSSGSINFTNGARACDVFWRVQTLATINGSSFAGTIYAGTGIHFGANVTLNGRALAVGGDVTMISDTITGPSCAAPPSTATLTVVKHVVNDDAGVSTANAWTLSVASSNGGSGTGSAVGAELPGTNYTIQAGKAYSVAENGGPSGYSGSASSNCSIASAVASATYTCTITNDDIPAASGVLHTDVPPPAPVTSVVGDDVPPPLIDIVKVPSRLTPFPFGGGEVTYVYTVTNPGVVALHDVSVTDDKCAPVSLIAGDTNADNLLDLTETWNYTCKTNVSVSTRNVATAMGTANGFPAIDYAFATVLVASPGLPNTGFPPYGGNASRDIAIISALLTLISVPLAVILVKRAARSRR